MKLDGEWISRMAERMTDAEDELKGAGVFTHRPVVATTQADVAVLEAKTIEVPGYRRYSPSAPPELIGGCI